jgi:hypothetical protein
METGKKCSLCRFTSGKKGGAAAEIPETNAASKADCDPDPENRELRTSKYSLR